MARFGKRRHGARMPTGVGGIGARRNGVRERDGITELLARNTFEIFHRSPQAAAIQLIDRQVRAGSSPELCVDRQGDLIATVVDMYPTLGDTCGPCGNVFEIHGARIRGTDLENERGKLLQLIR